MDCSVKVLKKICCICLSNNRKLFQLCRVPDGVNNLYLLLSNDSEAYREGFFKNTGRLFICWECRAVMCRLTQFRQQACKALKLLSDIADGRLDIKSQHCLSKLSRHHSIGYRTVVSTADNMIDNFIDCGANSEDYKNEMEEDVALSELNTRDIKIEIDEGMPPLELNDSLISDTDIEPFIIENKKKKRTLNNELYYKRVRMSDDELKEVLMSKKMSEEFVGSIFKCDSCVEVFMNEGELKSHNSSLHLEKPNHKKCDICLVYTKESLLEEHIDNHYHKHSCLCCKYVSYDLTEMMTHLNIVHGIKLTSVRKMKKVKSKTQTKNPGISNVDSDVEKPTPYLCTECNQYFANKNERWKHVQRQHREGHPCPTCDKRFAFRHNLIKHQRFSHQGSLPRTECPVCHKMVREDQMKYHARIHTDREQFKCVECAKSFICRASYEHHLKYTQAHAAANVFKYRCTVCEKGYRSRAELRDHVNYQHIGKTQHKCPICNKALATRRCITRHVRRAHEGVKQTARDKICQQCGKAFRDKKSLKEHELIHTGERPLSCEVCGCTFRQKASLYTHKKRVHKIFPASKKVELME